MERPRGASDSTVALWSNDSSLRPAIETAPGVADRRYSVAVVTPGAPLAAEALELEAEVFGQRFGNSREFLDEMYAGYDDSTWFVLVRDEHAGLAVGMLRLIVGSAAGLPSVDAMAGEPWFEDPGDAVARSVPRFRREKTLDIAMIAVRRGWGSSETALLLFHEITRFTADHGIETWVALLNNKVLERLQLLGRPFSPYEGVASAPYAGSELSTPVWAIPSETYARMDAGVYACVVEGRGLHEIAGRRNERQRRFAR